MPPDHHAAARLAAVLEAALDCVIVIDHTEAVVEFNPAAERAFGRLRADVLGRPLSEVVIPERLRDAHRRGLARYLATGDGPVIGRRVEMPAVRSDGTEFPAELAIVPTVIDGRPVFTGYLRDITDRKRAEAELRDAARELEARVAERTAELRAANAELERAARLRDEFLATVSHELRTPLNGVLGAVGLLADTPLDDAQRGYVRTARASAELLLSAVGDMLDFTRLEAGTLDPDRADYRPAAVAAEAAGLLADRAAAKGLRLDCRPDPSADGSGSGDRGRVRQVLVNLLSNAVKFTDRGGVTVRAAVEPAAGGRVARFAVADTGVGIPADRRDRLFRPFSQVDGSTTRRYEGAGLGLAISARLAELMGGGITVESEPGRGSTFTLTVPLGPPAAAPPAAPKSASPPAARRLRVLVAEDNRANQLVLSALLERLGHAVTVADTGRAAVAAWAAGAFDLILMDVQMPDLDGLGAAAAIRAAEAARGGRTPIVAVTAFAGRGDRERVRASGMDDFLTKPVVRDDLVRVLDRLAAPAGPFDRAAALARLGGDAERLGELADRCVRDWPRLLDAARRGDDPAAAARLAELATAVAAGPAAAAAERLGREPDAAEAVGEQFAALEAALRAMLQEPGG
jgi:PAS domain S-box-containing protein